MISLKTYNNLLPLKKCTSIRKILLMNKSFDYFLCKLRKLIMFLVKKVLFFYFNEYEFSNITKIPQTEHDFIVLIVCCSSSSNFPKWFFHALKLFVVCFFEGSDECISRYLKIMLQNRFFKARAHLSIVEFFCTHYLRFIICNVTSII